jgi:diguanylate cyclase (GGDEF)-like protein
MERLRESIEHARRYKRKMGLLYIDLDGFKEVNDTKGHDAGDELLIKIAEILRETTRTADIAARIGGDEFAIILFEVDSIDGAFNAGNHCLSNLDASFQLRAGTVKIQASIGVAVYPDHGSTPEEIINKADSAMYHSKLLGKNRCIMAGTKHQQD